MSVSYEFQMRTWLIRALLARIWPYRLLWNSYCWQHITGRAESMEIQSLSDTYEIMSGGNQISLMYRGGCGGRFVTRQICSKSQLENIFPTVPGKKKSSRVVLKNTIWELFIIRDFPLRRCTFRNVQLVRRFQAALRIYRCPLRHDLDAYAAAVTFFTTKLRLNHGVRLWMTLWLAAVFLCGPQRSGRLRQQRRAATSTCGYTPVITRCRLFMHSWTPGSRRLAAPTFICSHSLICLSVRVVAGS